MKNLNSDIQASSRIISIINRSKEQYENIINDLENAYAVINEKLEVLDANTVFSKFMNSYYFRENILNFFHKDSVPQLHSAINEVLEGSNNVSIELKARNSRLFLFNLSQVVVGRAQEGKIIKLLGTDITDLRAQEDLISDVFRTVSLGLLFVGADSKVMPGYSSFTKVILENFDLDGADIYEVLFYKNTKKISPDEVQALEDLRNIFDKDKNEFATISFMAPKLLEIPSKTKVGGRKVIQITLESIVQDSIVKRYLLILQDVTDIINLNPPRLNEDVSKMMKLIVDDYETLKSTLGDVQDLVSRVPKNITGIINEEIKGIFHTVKGLLRLLGLSYLGGMVHHLESVIKDNQSGQSVDCQKIWESFLVDLNKVKNIFDVFTNTDSASSNGGAEYLGSLITKINKTPLDIQTHYFLSPFLASVDVSFIDTKDLYRTLESLIVKNIDYTSIDVDYTPDFQPVELSKTSLNALKSCLIHLINNSFAHGFPTISRQCSIEIKLCSRVKNIEVHYIDNGAGVNVDKIRKKLKLESPDQSEFIDNLSALEVASFIFKSGLSTKDEADEMSGRGEGLSSAVLEIERLGGELKLISFENGCHFFISIPVVDRTLYVPTLVDSYILSGVFEVYFEQLKFKFFGAIDSHFYIFYPKLFYQAMRELEKLLENQSEVRLIFKNTKENFNLDASLDKINTILRFNHMVLIKDQDQNYYELVVSSYLNRESSLSLKKFKLLQDKLFHKIQNEYFHYGVSGGRE